MTFRSSYLGLRSINIQLLRSSTSKLEVFDLSEEITTKSAIQLAELIRAGILSPVEVVEAFLERIERINPSLNAIVTLAPDAIEKARAAEAALGSGQAVGVLHGVPLTIKDTIDTEGLRTTSGSRLRTDHVPERDATVVARLKAAGAIILGKTNTPEMAIPYETDNPVFGRATNPHNLLMTPGGSSGGEASAIAACLSPAGLGSDLSGSIRVPAHFCGIVGLKPTAGRVPMDGHVPASTGPLSLGASIGPMARDVKDLDLLFSIIADAAPFEGSSSKPAGALEIGALRGLRVASYIDEGVAPVTEETSVAVASAVQALSDAGLEVTEEKPPGIAGASRLWIELFSRAAGDQLGEMYQGREAEAGPLVSGGLLAANRKGNDMQARIEQAEALAAALVERERVREEILRWMKTTPLIVMPVGSVPAFAHGASRVDVKGQSISIFRAFGYSHAANVFGLPSVVVPAGRSAEGLPIGIQIIGRPFAERTILAAAGAIEEVQSSNFSL
jgi:amidase